MTCSIDPWLRATLTGYGLTGLFLAAFIGLVVFANRQHRREHWGTKPYKQALAQNIPSLFSFVCALAALATAITLALKGK